MQQIEGDKTALVSVDVLKTCLHIVALQSEVISILTLGKQPEDLSIEQKAVLQTYIEEFDSFKMIASLSEALKVAELVRALSPFSGEPKQEARWQ